jgi:hypothetical protein
MSAWSIICFAVFKTLFIPKVDIPVSWQYCIGCEMNLDLDIIQRLYVYGCTNKISVCYVYKVCECWIVHKVCELWIYKLVCECVIGVMAMWSMFVTVSVFIGQLLQWPLTAQLLIWQICFLSMTIQIWREKEEIELEYLIQAKKNRLCVCVCVCVCVCMCACKAAYINCVVIFIIINNYYLVSTYTFGNLVFFSFLRMFLSNNVLAVFL